MTVNNEIGVKQPMKEIGNHHTDMWPQIRETLSASYPEQTGSLWSCWPFTNFPCSDLIVGTLIWSNDQRQQLIDFYTSCPQVKFVVLKESSSTLMLPRLWERFPSTCLTGRLIWCPSVVTRSTDLKVSNSISLTWDFLALRFFCQLMLMGVTCGKTRT